jgi:hypothetical protein
VIMCICVTYEVVLGLNLYENVVNSDGCKLNE